MRALGRAATVRQGDTVIGGIGTGPGCGVPRPGPVRDRESEDRGRAGWTRTPQAGTASQRVDPISRTLRDEVLFPQVVDRLVKQLGCAGIRAEDRDQLHQQFIVRQGSVELQRVPDQ